MRQVLIQNNSTRAFHASPTAFQAEATDLPSPPSESGRRSIPLSAWDWSRPHKASQDSQDDVVPSYYIERRRQLDEISERKEAEGGLMTQLAAGILSEGIAAQTRVRQGKVPVEMRESDGTVRLASGFEPPTPATEFHPVVARNAIKGKGMEGTHGAGTLTSVKLSWDEALKPAPTKTAARATLNAKPQRRSQSKARETGFVGAAEDPKETFRNRDSSQD